MMAEKDPAFLFYSKDFYEGTRTMLPRERACLIDLMIYQHQHGAIPNDMERMVMYCSGLDEATLQATLQAKFRLTDDGWVNDKLSLVTEDRKNYKDGQSVNGRIGQFWKKVKSIVTAKELKRLKDVVYNEIGKDAFSKMLTDEKATLEGLLKDLLKHIAIADANENAIEDVSDSLNISKAPPKFEEVAAYFIENGYTEESARKAFNYYQASLTETKRHWSDGKGQPVKNWKQKMQSVWFKPENLKPVQQHGKSRHTFSNPIL